MTVTPVHGRPLCYHVSSSQKGEPDKLCDLTQFQGNGFCSCNDWGCRVVSNMKKPHALLTDATLCKHLRAAHLFNLSVQVELALAL